MSTCERYVAPIIGSVMALPEFIFQLPQEPVNSFFGLFSFRLELPRFLTRSRLCRLLFTMYFVFRRPVHLAVYSVVMMMRVGVGMVTTRLIILIIRVPAHRLLLLGSRSEIVGILRL